MAQSSSGDRPSNRTRGGAIARDPEAFEAFYREHIDALQRFIARRVGTPEAAADVAADVFLAAIQAADSYDPSAGPVKAWLFGIARHRIADSYRAAERESRATAALVGRELLDADDLARIHERLDAEATARELYQRLGSIPEPERAVLELVALDDLTVAEAAGALQITTVAARVRLHRARRRLGAVEPARSATPRPSPHLDLMITEPHT
ncbi:MAG TPA: RNA polymerase sigma factor [Solirubrobacteraceae bacterium]|nr:RNA polymerase sigma factor [Solirubrobacteraceae bacterium]